MAFIRITLVAVSLLSIVLPSSEAQDCGNTYFNETAGFISSPNWPRYYDNNLDCNYTIHAPAGSSHTLIFLNFSVETQFDYVGIRCASNASYPEIMFDGYASPPSMSIPWCSEAQVYFFTDYMVVYDGFLIEYQVSTGGCGNTAFILQSGTITSPGYPSNYDVDQNCSYVILADGPTSIDVTFETFSLQDDCSADWLEIRCIDDDSLYGRYCGASIPPDIHIDNCQKLLVWFSSDSSVVDSGFSAQYTMLMPERGYCGMTDFNETSGVITSGNYPADYENNLRCYYTIHATPGSTHILTFQVFLIQFSYDYLEVYCATNASFPRIRLSGYGLPRVTVIPWCANAQLYMYTDPYNTNWGFSLAYEVNDTSTDHYEAADDDDPLCGSTQFKGTSGFINSPGFPGDYYDDLKCAYIISSDTPSLFTLYFSSFSLEASTNCTCDWLEVRCLDDDTDYGRYCGIELPPENQVAVTKPCSDLLIWFSTNESEKTVYPGFELIYASTPEAE